jgi:hypothetical protein
MNNTAHFTRSAPLSVSTVSRCSQCRIHRYVGAPFNYTYCVTPSGPNYGKLQRQRANGKWISTRRFTQRQVNKDKI